MNFAFTFGGIRRARPLRDASRYLFLATLVYAPWAYGCTTAATIEILNWLLAAVLVLWVVDVLVRRAWPRIPISLAVTAALLVLLGWGMALNARAIYDPTYGLYALIIPPLRALPGSYDAPLSLAMMVRVTLLLGVICFVADLCRRPEWLLRLWQTIGIAGTSIALFGLIEKGLGARMIFWGFWGGKDPPSFFATYFYHANAGAYLNLVLAPTLGLTLRSITSRRSPFERALWIAAGIIVVTAVAANTSRGAQAFSVVVLVAFLAGPVWRVVRNAGAANKRELIVGVLIALVAVIAIAQASHLDQPMKRWQTVGDSLQRDARWRATLTGFHLAADAGLFGFGPGALRSILPSYQGETKLQGRWRFLHEDYLQTIAEWGWAGATLIGATFFGGMAVAFFNWRRRGEEWLPRQCMFVPLVLLSLGAVAAHSFIDFPLQIASIQLCAGTLIGVCWATPTFGRK